MTRLFVLCAMLGVLLGAAAPHAATATAAGPAELPPDDFAAAQYIDSAGCVFMRAGNGWVARLARDGRAICGYPPTLSARRTAPDTLAAIVVAPAEPAADRVRRELVSTVMAGLQTGELAGDVPGHRAAGDVRAAPDAAADHPVADPNDPTLPPLSQMVAAAPAMRRSVASGGTSPRLCDLLGAAQPDGSTPTGTAMGACGEFDALTLPKAQAVVAPAGNAPTHGAAVAVAADVKRAQTTAASTRGGAGQVTAPAGTTARATNVAAAKPATRPKAAQAGKGGTSTRTSTPRPLIPPGARYVQVGVFADDANAQRVARRLTAMGMPVARGRMTRDGKAVQMIMAGPFDGRQSLVRALDRVRRSGFDTAYPR